MFPEDHVTSGVEEMPLPNSRRPSHGGTTITCGVEESVSFDFVSRVANDQCNSMKNQSKNEWLMHTYIYIYIYIYIAPAYVCA
jgi:hypothetical protein